MKSFEAGQLQLVSFYPCGSHGKWVGCVKALLSIIDWPPIPEDGHLEVLHHRVNYLPVGQTQHIVAMGLPKLRSFWIDFVQPHRVFQNDFCLI